METEPLIMRLRRRAEIRRQIKTRKSVQEGKPDRIADLLEEAANALDHAENSLLGADLYIMYIRDKNNELHDEANGFPPIDVEVEAAIQLIGKEK